EGDCQEFGPDQVAELQSAVNELEDGATIVLLEGTFVFDNALTLRGNGLSLIGQGKDISILDFSGVAAQTNGVDAISDDILLEGFTVADAQKDGIRIEDSNGVTIRSVKVTWAEEGASTNGAYGIYPVRVRNVLMEDSEAYNASDAGIYVGQCQNAIVRNNIVKGNVAGLEIENTQFADVYGNLAEDNTGGLVVFDLPGNPIVGRDVRIHDNEIINNNRDNFAPGGTVAIIPAGTGSFAMASRRVEFDNNTYRNNQSVDIAIVSGLVVDGDTEKWHIETDAIVGDNEGLELMSDDNGVFNFRTEQIWIHDNTHEGSGLDIDDASQTRELGFLLGIVYNGEPIDEILYDTIGESSFDPEDPSLNSNDNQICVGVSDNMTFGSMDLENLQTLPSLANMFRPAPPFTPFDCEGVRPTAPEF
ncbi:MAG: parallel beta-helix domain-containing protein, partial [Myxococcota bacterium]